MFPQTSSGLSFAKIITGLSKSLNIAKQVIPIYEQAKPMVANARKAFSILKEININDLIKKGNTINNSNIETIHVPIKKTTLQKSSSFSGPSFFK